MSDINILTQHREHWHELQRLRESVKELKQRIIQPRRSILKYGDNSHRETDNIGDMLGVIEQAESKYYDSYSEYIRERQEIESILDSVPDIRERIVLRYRYYNGGMQWKEIIKKSKMNIQSSRMYAKIQQEALKHFEEAAAEQSHIKEAQNA